MSNLTKLKFVSLDILGKNYLPWVLDVKFDLDAKGLGNTIVANKEASNQHKTKVMIFICHHLHEGLKVEYLTMKDPLKLWRNLKERFDHKKMDLVEKTFSTFHATNMLLQQQYHEKAFKKYSELISCLLVVEQNNELLMKNHEIRPTGSAPIPEVNVVVHNKYGNEKYKGRDRGRGRGRGCGRSGGRGRLTSNRYHGVIENLCYRCGMRGHWARTCRTPEHLVKLYQTSIKGKKNNIETNFKSKNDEIEAKKEDETIKIEFLINLQLNGNSINR
ncbi:hypothetical protein V6Z12_D03G097600 [Gossypium hirsutum]